MGKCLVEVSASLRDALGHKYTFGSHMGEAIMAVLAKWAEESDALADLYRDLRDPKRLDANDWEGLMSDAAEWFLDELNNGPAHEAQQEKSGEQAP